MYFKYSGVNEMDGAQEIANATRTVCCVASLKKTIRPPWARVVQSTMTKRCEREGSLKNQLVC